jgi:hypothetical protein
MNIDNLISSFDFEKSKKDCILHSMFRIYMDKKSELFSCDDNKAIMLIKQLEEYSDVLKRLLSHAKCFPDSCDNCEGLTKCIDCIIKDNCVDAQLIFHKLTQPTVTT